MVNRKRRPRSNSASASPAGASSSPSVTTSARSTPPLRASAQHSSSATSNANVSPASSHHRRDSSALGLNSVLPPTLPEDGSPDSSERAAAPLLAFLTLSQARRPRDTTYTLAGVAAVLYADLISWAVREVAMRHRLRTHLTRSRARLAPPPLSLRTAAPSHPALHYSEKGVNAECSNCQSNVSASRYAQHLEKCLGRGGRVSSRAASARMKLSAERAEREESEDQSHRRRRAGSNDADNSSKSSKRRRPSPVPGAAVRSGLPPSGRNR